MDNKTTEEQNREDLGLGSQIIEENKGRFLNADGSFNLRRKGVDSFHAISFYHRILDWSWGRFYSALLVWYLAANTIFTLMYLFLGGDDFAGIAGGSTTKFFQIFFFSIQTLTSLGSSPIRPTSLAANAVLSVEAMVGLVGFSLAAALIFARLSNPDAKIVFSKRAIFTPYKDMKAFMFRMINGRSDELIEVKATLNLSMLDKEGRRRIYELPLERSSVSFFPIHWTVVHPIDQESLLFGMNLADLQKADAEFLVVVSAIDEHLSQRIYARHSYKYFEVLDNVKFAKITEHGANGAITVNPNRISEIEKV